MAERKAGIGFLGTGFMGQLAHLANYADNPACRVVALAKDCLKDMVILEDMMRKATFA